MASKYIQKFPVPQNFPEILHDLSKEILRNQPEDIIEFCALYFKCTQEGLVLDYHRKGQNIACDFNPTIPKISTKSAMRKEQSVEDERAKKVTVQSNSSIVDLSKKSKIKEENKGKTKSTKDDLNFVVHHREKELNEGDESHVNPTGKI